MGATSCWVTYVGGGVGEGEIIYETEVAFLFLISSNPRF